MLAARIRHLHLAALAAVALAVWAGDLPAQEPPRADRPAVEDDGPAASPRAALFRSLVLPGWGHAYAGAPGRGAIYFGLASGSVWMTYVARRQLQDSRREQEWLRLAGELEPLERTELVEARAQHFEDWAALSVFLFFLAGADAYVAAYLADFDDRIGVSPEADGGFRFEARIPVGQAR
jgi:hypothetical protein